MNDNVKPAPVHVSEAELNQLRQLLEKTDYAIVRKTRVRTLTAQHAVAPQELARVDVKMMEEQIFRQLAFAVVEELVESGAMRQRIGPLISADGSRTYRVVLDVFMPDGSGFPMEPR